MLPPSNAQHALSLQGSGVQPFISRMLPSDKRLIIRHDDTKDWPAVRRVHEAAFGRTDEANLVDTLRTEGVVAASLVATLGSQIVGHILFSRMAIHTPGGSIPAIALAPLGVSPGYQRHGIGQQLVRSGIDYLRERGERIVIVLGHPEYYSRFGFSTAKARSLENPFRPDAFMALELTPDALDGVHGKVKYPAAFGL